MNLNGISQRAYCNSIFIAADYSDNLVGAGADKGLGQDTIMVMPISPAAFNAVRWTRIAKALAKLTICVVAVTAVTAVLYLIPLSDRSAFSALTFLFVVLIVSTVWHFGYAVFVSFLTALGFSWLLPPVGVFWLDDLRDVFTLAAFLLIGIITSYLSERCAKRDSECQEAPSRSFHCASGCAAE